METTNNDGAVRVTTDGEYEIRVSAWSGNVKPFQARVLLNGAVVGVTGFCKTENRAIEAARPVIAAHRAEVSR